jgi:hypothetical protein
MALEVIFWDTVRLRESVTLSPALDVFVCDGGGLPVRLRVSVTVWLALDVFVWDVGGLSVRLRVSVTAWLSVVDVDALTDCAARPKVTHDGGTNGAVVAPAVVGLPVVNDDEFNRGGVVKVGVETNGSDTFGVITRQHPLYSKLPLQLAIV